MQLIGKINAQSTISLPLYTSLISAGFPSPAEDYQESGIDLNSYLISNPAATFLVRVQGDSMSGGGIFPGDVLVVDRSKEVKNGDVVVAIVDGSFTVKSYRITPQGNVYLDPQNSSYKPLKITNEIEFQIWGVVTCVLHKPTR